MPVKVPVRSTGARFLARRCDSREAERERNGSGRDFTHGTSSAGRVA
jgi:hypothetical protein